MKFLFIIQGEGRGHLTQAIRLRKILNKHGHDVEEVFMGKSPQRRIPSWADREIGMRINYFNSPNFIRRRDKKGIRILHSFIYNFFRIPFYFYSLFFLIRHIRRSSAEIVINFYDVIGGLAFCFSFSGKKMYSISHQHFFEHPVFEWPGGYPVQKFLLKLHTRLTSLCVESSLALSFTKEEDLSSSKIFIVPPLIETEFKQTDHNESYVLVYFLNEGFLEELKELIKVKADMKFIVFTDIDNFVNQRNLIINKPHRNNFLKLLPGAKALITTSGFETLCESAYFRKPFHPIPSRGHYEQLCNAVDAKRAGLIDDYGNLNSKTLFNLADEVKSKKFRYWCAGAEEHFLKILFS